METIARGGLAQIELLFQLPQTRYSGNGNSDLHLGRTILYSLLLEKMQKLQLVQNAEARLLTGQPHHCRITWVLNGLCWLLLGFRLNSITDCYLQSHLWPSTTGKYYR